MDFSFITEEAAMFQNRFKRFLTLVEPRSDPTNLFKPILHFIVWHAQFDSYRGSWQQNYLNCNCAVENQKGN